MAEAAEAEARAVAEAVARRSYGRLVALLAARTGDVAGAEDALSEALRQLGEEPEALGRLALMLHAQARRDARRDARGEYVPLAEQDPAAWDAERIAEAEALLARASALPGTGRFQLEAAVQSAHAVRRHSGRSDWAAIERIYDALLEASGSPVVAVNRAVAVAETRGPEAGLAALEALAKDRRLAAYQPYWAARAELLARARRPEPADAAYDRAIGLERDPAVRRFLERRRAALAQLPPPGRPCSSASLSR